MYLIPLLISRQKGKVSREKRRTQQTSQPTKKNRIVQMLNFGFYDFLFCAAAQ